MCHRLELQIIFIALLMWCNVLRKFRAFRANHCNLSWNKRKEYSAGHSCFIPVPTASQRDSGSHLSAAHVFCSTEPQHERYPPLSRTFDEPAARHLETKAKHRVRTHISPRILSHLIYSVFQSQWLFRLFLNISGDMVLFFRTIYFLPRQVRALEISFHWTRIFFTAVAIHWLWETKWNSF